MCCTDQSPAEFLLVFLRFLLQLSCQSPVLDGPANFSVVETNAFKHLNHLSLRLAQGSDKDIKDYLAVCLSSLKVCSLTINRLQQYRTFQLGFNCKSHLKVFIGKCFFGRCWVTFQIDSLASWLLLFCNFCDVSLILVKANSGLTLWLINGLWRFLSVLQVEKQALEVKLKKTEDDLSRQLSYAQQVCLEYIHPPKCLLFLVFYIC